MKTNKYLYLYAVQGNYGQGWEDLTVSEDWREVWNDHKAYKDNEPEYPHRLIRRRELNPEWEKLQ